MSKCLKCEKELIPLEMSLHRKLVDKTAEKFYCKTCLSNYIGLSEKKLDEIAEYYKGIGCLLFKTD